MTWLRQIGALTLFNLLTLRERRGSVAAAMVGIAGVVAVLVGMLSIAQGIERTMAVTGSPDTAIILRAGSDTELTVRAAGSTCTRCCGALRCHSESR